MTSKEELFHVVAINEKSGTKTVLTEFPLTQDKANILRSKFNPHALVRIQIEHV
jgi:hypothetical protein